MDLFFDVETTGLPPYRGCPATHADMPHLVQFAAILSDPVTERECASVSMLVRPEGWEIDDKIAELTGITHEMASAAGVTEWSAAMMFAALARAAKRVIAHNLAFDVQMMDAALVRAAQKTPRLAVPHLDSLLGDDVERICTMQLSLPVLDLPPTEKMVAAGFNKPKPPKLGEAYEFFKGEPLVGAHDALVDVRACRDVFLALQAKPETV